MELDTAAAPPRRARPGLLAGVAALLLAVVAVAWGVLSRGAQTRDAQRWSNQEATPAVTVVTPSAGTGVSILSLPGDLAAENTAQIFARVSGYIHAWYQDIGARVGAGQLLATLDTPDVDQQVLQARADLASAQAQQHLSATTAKRWSDLAAVDAVSKQESDEKSGDLAARTAGVGASKAALNRLLALKSFARITAPFAGVVTARTANIGDLVNAGASGSQPLFTVSDVSRIRVYVRVPQNASADLHPGIPAVLHLPEFANRTFTATVGSTSGAIQQQSGTLLVELSAANPDGALKPGAFATVEFRLQQPRAVLRLPASALLFRKEGLSAAVLDSSNRVHLRRLTVARDLGPQVEVASGIAPTDRVVDNPPDSLIEGEQVRLASPHA